MAWQLVAYAVMFLYSLYSSYRQAGQGQQNVSPEEMSAATVDASSPVPVLFGTRLISSPNCVWWGDVGTTPIKTGGGGKK